MRVASSLFVAAGAAFGSLQSAVSPMSQVVKLLEDTLKDMLDERTNTEAAYKKMDCLTKKTVEAIMDCPAAAAIMGEPSLATGPVDPRPRGVAWVRL